MSSNQEEEPGSDVACVEEIFRRKTLISLKSWLVKNNVYPPPNHMLELPGIHIWKSSSSSRVGISDDGLLLWCLPQICLLVGNSGVGISEYNLAMGHSNIPIWIICIGLIAHGLHEELVWWWGWDGWYGIIGRMIYILALDPLSIFRHFDRILPDGQYDIPHKSLVGELPIRDGNLGRRQGATNVFFATQTN